MYTYIYTVTKCPSTRFARVNLADPTKPLHDRKTVDIVLTESICLDAERIDIPWLSTVYMLYTERPHIVKLVEF